MGGSHRRASFHSGRRSRHVLEYPCRTRQARPGAPLRAFHCPGFLPEIRAFAHKKRRWVSENLGQDGKFFAVSSMERFRCEWICSVLPIGAHCKTAFTHVMHCGRIWRSARPEGNRRINGRGVARGGNSMRSRRTGARVAGRL